jgi:hypothetical protein
LTDTVRQSAALLSLAQTYAEDGAMATALSRLDAARALLDDSLGPTDLTHPGCAGALESAYVRLWLSTVPAEVLEEALGDPLLAEEVLAVVAEPARAAE